MKKMNIEQEYKRRRNRPSLSELDREFSEIDRREQEALSKEWTRNCLLNSRESVDRIAAKAVTAGLISYACIEQVHSSHGFEHKGPAFLRREINKQWHHRSVKRTILER
jgi:hypothetical protein